MTNQETPEQGRPTEEQIEAAARAIWATRYPESRPDIAEATWVTARNLPEGIDVRAEAAAALSASASSHATDKPHDAGELSDAVLALAVKIRGKADRSANTLGEIALGDEAYAEAELLRQASTALAAPVEVDQAKLSEVMLSHKMTTYGAHNFWGCAECGERYVDTGIGILRWFAQHHAHAVAEWLRGEGRC